MNIPRLIKIETRATTLQQNATAALAFRVHAGSISNVNDLVSEKVTEMERQLFEIAEALGFEVVRR